jgi:hypothetical protein
MSRISQAFQVTLRHLTITERRFGRPQTDPQSAFHKLDTLKANPLAMRISDC